MRQHLLTASPLRLFVYLFVVPIVCMLPALPLMPRGGDMSAVAGLNLVVVCWLLYWLYTVGTGLHGRVPEEIRGSSACFRGGLIFVALHISALSVAMMMKTSLNAIEEAMLILVPTHVISMLFMFYSLCFLATAYTSATRQVRVPITERIGPFMLFWFYPAGIWALQPQVRELFLTDSTPEQMRVP